MAYRQGDCINNAVAIQWILLGAEYDQRLTPQFHSIVDPLFNYEAIFPMVNGSVLLFLHAYKPLVYRASRRHRGMALAVLPRMTLTHGQAGSMRERMQTMLAVASTWYL
jgi:hypothetical protein